jgi:F-type H+-transporting ATPase subunit epsilon
VIIPGQEGDFTALANHAPFISALRPGILRIPSLDGREARFYLRGGFAEVSANETVVLAELAVPLEEFSAERLSEELALAERAHEAAADEAARFRTIDVVERLRSLQVPTGSSAGH